MPSDKESMKCNKPRRTPSHPKKSHVVKACEDGKERLIRFGQQGVSGSPKKEGESESYRKRRESFKARHAKNIAKGKMSAAYWADKVKWAEGGSVNLEDLHAKYAEGGEVGGTSDVARSVLGQGLLLGWGDEAEAWLRSKAGDQEYEDILREIQASNRAYAEQHPIASLSGEVAGALLPTVGAYLATPFTGGAAAPAAAVGTTRLAQLASRLPTWAKGALFGGTEGAIVGAGMADLDESRLLGAAEGTLIGAPVGAAGATAIDAFGNLMNRRALERAAQQVPDESAYEPLRQMLEEQGDVMYAVKGRGGNWLDFDLQHELRSLKRPLFSDQQLRQLTGGSPQAAYDPESLARLSGLTMEEVMNQADPAALAINRWIDTKLSRYIRNEMGTPDDPVRDLMDRGVSHYDVGQFFGNETLDAARRNREITGYPIEGYAQTPMGRLWEARTDRSISPHTVSDVLSNQSAYGYAAQSDPWILDAPPETPIYSLNAGRMLGFRELMYDLHEAMQPDSDLPVNLRIRPKDLEKINLPQAVQRVNDINDWRVQEAARAEREILVDNLQNNARLEDPNLNLSFVDIPGGKWVDLPEADSESGMSLCSTIGKAGGWCTQGEGPETRRYNTDNKRTTALIDAEGRPHVQVSYSNVETPYDLWLREMGENSPEVAEFNNWLNTKHPVPVADPSKDQYIENPVEFFYREDVMRYVHNLLRRLDLPRSDRNTDLMYQMVESATRPGTTLYPEYFPNRFREAFRNKGMEDDLDGKFKDMFRQVVARATPHAVNALDRLQHSNNMPKFFEEWARETNRSIPEPARSIFEIKPVENSFTGKRAQEYQRRDPEYRDKISDSVLDFLNKESGSLDEVDDLDYFDIVDMNLIEAPEIDQLIREIGQDVPRFMTKRQINDLTDLHGLPPFSMWGEEPDGFAKGGMVRRKGYAEGGEVGGTSDVARSVLGQGLMLGWGDEAEAWLRSKAGDEDYEDILREIQASNRAYSEQHPIASLSGEVAGALLPTVGAYLAAPFTGGASAPAAAAGTTRIAQLASRLPTWAKGALFGATEGAVVGAGMADLDESRLEGATTGAAFGAPLGAAGATAIDALGNVINRRAIESAAQQVPDESAYEPLRQMLEEQGDVMYAVKGRGGNWLDTNIQGMLDSYKLPLYNQEDQIGRVMQNPQDQFNTARIADFFGITEEEVLSRANPKALALNRWIDTKMGRYIKNEMATQDDPVRQLAESGVLHYSPSMEHYELGPVLARAERYRESAGDVGTTYAQEPLARLWETYSDAAIMPRRVGDFGDYVTQQNPWMERVPPETVIHTIGPDMTLDAGFRHLINQMSDALDPESDLPANLRIDPKDLDKITFPQAVQRVSRINDWRTQEAARAEREAMMANLQASARLEDPNLNLSFVENPGGRWVDIPETAVDGTPVERNMSLCTAIGNAGGWCTQQGTAARSYGSGDNRLVALLDNDGRPHVQVQINNSRVRDTEMGDVLDEDEAVLDQFYRNINLLLRERAIDDDDIDRVMDYVAFGGPRTNVPDNVLRILPEIETEAERMLPKVELAKPDINQLKPVENTFGGDRAREYMRRDPQYKQKISDSLVRFLNGGDWGKVSEGDLHAFDIIDLNGSDSTLKWYLDDIYEGSPNQSDSSMILSLAREMAPPDTPRFMTRGQFIKFLEPYEPLPPEGYAKGGAVRAYARGGVVRKYDPATIEARVASVGKGYARGGVVKYNPAAVEQLVSKFRGAAHV